MRRSTVYGWLTVLLIIGQGALALWFVLENHTLRADLAYRTAAWEQCNAELEGGRD